MTPKRAEDLVFVHSNLCPQSTKKTKLNCRILLVIRRQWNSSDC